MTTPVSRPLFDWEAAGRELGGTLGAYNAIVVIGSNPVATGRVAVGIARAQSSFRRVALGDLFAESPPIQALVNSDDPHGLVDSFLYGVSITKIAHQVPDAGELFVMPSGTHAPPYEEILPSPRWQRLAAGFREMQALLILAAPASAPRVGDLIAAMDGAVLVGDAIPGSLPDVTVLGAVREPRPNLTPRTAAPTPKPKGLSKKQIAGIAAIIPALLIVGFGLWLAYRPYAKTGSPRKGPPATIPAPPGSAVSRIVPTLDSVGKDTTTATASTATPPAPPVTNELRVVNPNDSAQVAAFAVELMATNTQAGAIFKLQKDGKDLPAATFAPALIQGARWFKVVSGAYLDRAGADSLLANLRRRKQLLGGESVVRLPFAFRVDSGVPAAAVPRMVAEYAVRGQPVYALRQDDGTAWLLFGAFMSLEQAALDTESLRASGFPTVLVYRKGRMF